MIPLHLSRRFLHSLGVCLIALAWRMRADLPLVVAANRDEFYDRPTRPALVWDDAPQVIGGRDLRAGGSWLAAGRGGRFAAVTNIRYAQIESGPSRGALVSDFMRGSDEPLAFLQRLAARARDYAGFHLILGDGETLAHFSNASNAVNASNTGIQPSVLEPGLFGVSNAPPGVEWPKVTVALEAVAGALGHDPETIAAELLDFLSTPRGTPIESEVFVSFPDRGYGTRSSTVVIVNDRGKVLLHERSWPAGATTSVSV